MLRPLILLQACFLMAASAQPIDARENLIYPTNPPKPASSKTSAASIQKALAAQLKAVPAKPVFAVSKVDLDETDPTAKELKLTISHSASENPDPSKVRILAYFYEADGAGKVQLTGSKMVSNWTSAPIDWSEDQAEELTMRYTVPAAGSGKYVGYVVGVYYKDLLQDSSSNSPELLEKFPLPTSDGKAGFASGSAGAAGLFLEAYKSFQAAENSFAEGDLAKAKEAAQKSLATLTTLQKASPDWQPRVVAYRIASAKLLEAKIDEK